jgi:aspartyl-tRNA(Asn)/glutamyl-tRNA(Gln) amidotransferase subunit C
MRVSREDVLHIAKLAHLRLEEDEIAAFQNDLGNILGHIEQLNELDTQTIAPTAHVAVTAAPLRMDEVVQGLRNEEALAEAPRPREGGFAVPAFIDEG